MSNKIIRVQISSYQLDWIEQAKNREERGQPVDEGTLATLGALLLEGVIL